MNSGNEADATPKRRLWIAFRGACLTFTAIIVVCLQIALPLIAYLHAGSKLDPSGKMNDESNGNGFWSQRLRFEEFLDLTDIEDPQRYGYWFASATVLKSELTILLGKYASNVSPNELVRVNLRTGRMTSSPAPAGCRHVLSDGEKIWWLPPDQNLAHPRNQWYTPVATPFMFNGRPVIITRDLDAKRPLFRLQEFVENHWQLTDDYVFLNRIFAEPNLVQNLQGHISILTCTGPGVYYQKELQLGSKADVMRSEEPGYIRIPIRFASPNAKFRYPSDPFGFWFEAEEPCSVDVQTDEKNLKIIGFNFARYRQKNESECEFLSSPIRWGPRETTRPWTRTDQQILSVQGTDGAVFLVSCGVNCDGRLHVLKKDNGRLVLIARRGSAKMWLVCLDAALLFGLVVVVPMLLLSGASVILERCQSPRRCSFGHETLTLATAARRGMARTTDLIVLLMILAGPNILDPDFIGWWHEMNEQRKVVSESFSAFVNAPGWWSFRNTVATLPELLPPLFHLPALGWTLVAGSLFLVTHLVWQARSGKSIGKWLWGISVLRTTHRPCGLARSLLREILLSVDAVMLLSWVPGVISILATGNSQRIGDLIADTVVVRDA